MAKKCNVNGAQLYLYCALNVAGFLNTYKMSAVVVKLFDSVPLDEIIEPLNLMCETYVLYAPVERADLAQKVSVVNLLNSTLIGLSKENNQVTS